MAILEDLERRVNNLEKVIAGTMVLLENWDQYTSPRDMLCQMMDDYLKTSGFYGKQIADVRPPFRSPGD